MLAALDLKLAPLFVYTESCYCVGGGRIIQGSPSPRTLHVYGFTTHNHLLTLGDFQKKWHMPLEFPVVGGT